MGVIWNIADQVVPLFFSFFINIWRWQNLEHIFAEPQNESKYNRKCTDLGFKVSVVPERVQWTIVYQVVHILGKRELNVLYYCLMNFTGNSFILVSVNGTLRSIGGLFVYQHGGCSRRTPCCLTGCNGYLCVVNLQLRCSQLTVTFNYNQKRLYAIDPSVSPRIFFRPGGKSWWCDLLYIFHGMLEYLLVISK